jgi:hypothetical protein
MTSFIDKFNTTLGEFVDDLIRVCPQFTDLKGYQISLKAAVFITPKVPVQIFYDMVTTPYGSQIAVKNEEFFLAAKYEEQTGGNHLNIVETIKSIWKGLDESNKECIWKYLTLLVILSKRCI